MYQTRSMFFRCDYADSTCAIKSGTGIPFSNFDGFNGDTAVWSTGPTGFSGTMNFLRDPSVTVPTLINNGLNGQVFDVTLALPSCQQQTSKKSNIFF